MNIVAFIPARSGSKSIPNKNTKLLGGKPLIAYTIETAQKAGMERIICSTDGEDIAKVARQYGAEVLVRPAELAKDETPMFAVVVSEIPKIEPQPDFVMLLQPTSPFRKKIHLQMAMSLFAENLDKYDSLISAERVPEKYNPGQVIVTTPFGHKMANGSPISHRATRRQDFGEAHTPTGSIYLFKTSNLEKGSFYGDNVMLMETEGELNINTADDWALAEQLCKQRS
jgi:N-acylneuraminate cytidylyltransferase